MQSVRPAYMDEYEKLEAQLKALYEQFVAKFRNLAYLSQLQLEYDKLENERQMVGRPSWKAVVWRWRCGRGGLQEAEISLRRMAEAMREEERARLAEAGRIDLGDGDGDGGSPSPAHLSKAPRVYGNITGAGLSDDEEEDEEDASLLSEEEDDEVVVQRVHCPPLKLGPEPCRDAGRRRREAWGWRSGRCSAAATTSATSPPTTATTWPRHWLPFLPFFDSDERCFLQDGAWHGRGAAPTAAARRHAGQQ